MVAGVVLTALILPGLSGWPIPAAAAPASERAYTIANYPVEATAKNAVAAKETAIADGQKAAFRSLLKRIVPVTAYRSLDRLGSVDAASLIDGVAVRSERNSATRYIASLDFSFQAAEVRTLLTQQGIPYVDSQAPQTLLVPLIRDAKGTGGTAGEFRPASGTWASVWPSLDLTNTVAPLRIETLKPEIGVDVLRALESDTGGSVVTLSSAYGTEQVVVAIAEVDTGAQRVHVLLAGQDAAGPFALKRSYRVNDGDVAYTLELAAVVSQGILEGRWKAVNETGGAAAGGAYGAAGPGEGYGGAGGFGGSGQDVAFEAEFAERGEWDQMRRVLLEAPGIDDIRIGSVSTGRASISVKYPGGGPALAQALASYGLLLQDAGGVLVMRSQRR
jgi:hypothetical protein